MFYVSQEYQYTFGVSIWLTFMNFRRFSNLHWFVKMARILIYFTNGTSSNSEYFMDLFYQASYFSCALNFLELIKVKKTRE